jgi:hypothetical protein
MTAVGDTSPAVGDARRTWWRTHQVAAIGLYLAAVVAGWLERMAASPTSAIFIGMSVVAAIVGVLRGHLVFTALTHIASVDVERQRVERVTLVLDLAIAARCR